MQQDVDFLGKIIGGKYIIEERIGEGGVGVVYKGRDQKIGRSVAIKVLNPWTASSSEHTERLRREARLTGGLGHNNIVTVYDMGETSEGAPYIVMEFLDGKDLGAILEENEKDKKIIERELIIQIILQVLAALMAAHRNGVVHRDMKPENIFITEGQIAKILDFGIAKSAQEETSKLTREGMVFGSPWYMSPEQAMGRVIDQRSDIFSVGAILYEMLTGGMLNQGNNYQEAMMNVASRQIFPKISVIGSSSLEGIVLQALAFEPDERFQTASEFADALREAISGDEPESLDINEEAEEEGGVGSTSSSTAEPAPTTPAAPTEEPSQEVLSEEVGTPPEQAEAIPPPEETPLPGPVPVEQGEEGDEEELPLLSEDQGEVEDEVVLPTRWRWGPLVIAVFVVIVLGVSVGLFLWWWLSTPSPSSTSGASPSDVSVEPDSGIADADGDGDGYPCDSEADGDGETEEADASPLDAEVPTKAPSDAGAGGKVPWKRGPSPPPQLEGDGGSKQPVPEEPRILPPPVRREDGGVILPPPTPRILPPPRRREDGGPAPPQKELNPWL